MEERRRYFRINDEFQLRYRRTDATSRTEDPDDVAQRAVRNMLDRLRTAAPDMAEIVTVLDARIARLENGAAGGRLATAEVVPGKNISGCGVAFLTDEEMSPGQMLDMELLLEGGSLQIHALGKVVSIQETTDDSRVGARHDNFVRVDLLDMHPEDEEALVQFVLRRQVHKLRETRTRDEARD